MKKPRLVFSDAAASDILEQADWYIEQSGQTLANRWEKAIGSALLRIVKNPLAGPLCSFRHEELRDIRRAPVRQFTKHLIFYRFRDPEIFVLRVVHGARDLENLF